MFEVIKAIFWIIATLIGMLLEIIWRIILFIWKAIVWIWNLPWWGFLLIIIFGLLAITLIKIQIKTDQDKKRSKDNQSNNKKSYHENTDQDKKNAFDPYEILKVSRNSSKKEQKEAYRNLAAKYHPDKCNHLGPDFIKMAEKILKDLNRAKDELNL